MRLNWNKLSEYRGQLYGLSILLIVGLHLVMQFPDQLRRPWVISMMFQNGGIGVDAFLFLSGISMYYAVKKNEDKGQGFLRFYQRRLVKIAAVYLFFCFPYLLWLQLYVQKSPQRFFQQAFFLNIKSSTFWFLPCIILCYFIYPLIYYFIKEKKEGIVWGGVLLYVVLLFVARYIAPNCFVKFENMITRFPIFVIGSLCGKHVYQKKDMPDSLVWIGLLMLLLKGPLFWILELSSYKNILIPVMKRLFMGAQALGFILLAVMILSYVHNQAIHRMLIFLGTITLEIYVVHIALRDAIFCILKPELGSMIRVCAFSVVYVLVSVALAKLLHELLNLPKRHQLY